METEKSPTKKPRKVMKIMLKFLSKSKLFLDMKTLLKQGHLAREAISCNLKLLRRHSDYLAALTCRSNDVNLSFISPRDYEFSCSNTPVYWYFNSRRKNCNPQVMIRHEEMFNAAAAKKMMEASPLPRRSPAGGETVSAGETHVINQVDRDAEAFIRKFYRDLNKQKQTSATAMLESPSPHHLWGR